MVQFFFFQFIREKRARENKRIGKRSYFYTELFQQTFTEMLKNIPNQKLATDDIIVYGRTAEECQLYTDMILVTLNELGVTLSTD